jgi:23S rRNA (guanosine2251-2'-O)-methyltransferase
MKPKLISISALLCDIRSQHNVGSMFRTADGAGLDRLYLCGETAYPPRDGITKTALGAEEAIPWEYGLDPLECAKSLIDKGVRLIALETDSRSIDYRKIGPMGGSVCLIVGNEVGGIPSNLLRLCETSIRIPMRGKKESLNVSVAFGVAAYELTRGMLD